MYEAIADPYCYRGTTILRNKLGIRNSKDLEAYEAEVSRQRSSEPLPEGRLSLSHYRAIHRHLFQDVYSWAGRLRTVRIHKGESTFAYPEHLASEAARLFSEMCAENCLCGRSAETFASRAAHFLSELNALHLFRDGNGRSQLIFLSILAERAGHPLDLVSRLGPTSFLAAMIESFQGREEALTAQILQLIRR